MKKAKRAEQGFSLLETMVVAGILLTLVSFAIIQSFGSMESYRANAAMDVVIGQLRVARQLAISQRRNVKITFNTASSPLSVTYQVMPNPGDTYAPTAVTIPLSPQVTFSGVAGEIDTPMGFGTCSGGFGVCIANVSGGPPSMYYTSVGHFTDATLVNPLNGTIFLAVPNQPSTARAVTIMGSTGRVRSYNFMNGTPPSWTE
jgi:type II secretory pathway pseudopilin PulG